MYSLKLTLQTYDLKNFLIVDKLLHKKNTIKFLDTLKFTKIPLKTKIKNFTVLKSPHVNKTSREHFQYKTYRRLYTIHNSKILPLLFINNFFFKKLTHIFLIHSKISYKCL